MSRNLQPLACLAISVALVGTAAAQTIQINRENKTIAISATDQATAPADVAAITIGFEVFGPESQSTFVAGSRLSHSILEALSNAGVKNECVESAQQNLQRNTDLEDKATVEERRKRQFVFSQSWTVSVSPDFASQVIRVAVAAGANKSGDIDWRLSDRKILQARAAENALVKARAIAANMADGLHVKLGTLIYASNETPKADFYSRVQNASASPMANSRYPAPPPPPPLELRSQTIREEATVYAVFAIE